MAFRKTSYTHKEFHDGRHRFEHWYRDNTCYFITSKVRDGFHAFRSDEAKEIFWDRFTHYCARYNFVPWIVTLLVNHYHVLGYLKRGENLGPLMQHIHGSVAKLVNDLLPERHLPFWRRAANQDYFDGCLRDVLQLTRAYNYTKLQAVRARMVTDYRLYPDTRLYVPLAQTIEFATTHDSFLEDLPYARYERNRARKNRKSH